MDKLFLWRVNKTVFLNIYHKSLCNQMDWAIPGTNQPRKNRPRIMRKLGCKVGKGVFVGDHVKY